jgi:hypothetical protein
MQPHARIRQQRHQARALHPIPPLHLSGIPAPSPLLFAPPRSYQRARTPRSRALRSARSHRAATFTVTSRSKLHEGLLVVLVVQARIPRGASPSLGFFEVPTARTERGTPRSPSLVAYGVARVRKDCVRDPTSSRR